MGQLDPGEDYHVDAYRVTLEVLATGMRSEKWSGVL